MSNSKQSILGLIGVLSVFIFIILLIILTPDGVTKVLRDNWVCDSVYLGLSVSILVIIVSSHKCDLLGAPVFFGVIYILMFFVTPLYDIYIGETSIFGVMDLFDYGIKGSTLAFAGFFLFCVTFSLKVSNTTQMNVSVPALSYSVQRRVEKVAIMLWVILFITGLVCTILTTGFSASYILSFGLFGDSNAHEGGVSFLGFIQQFTRGIVPLSLIIFAISKKRLLVYAILVLTVFFEIITGFRYMIVILICSFFYYSFISRNRRVRIHHILLLAFSLALIVGIVGYSRNSVRAGTGFNSEGFGGDAITEAVLGNFRIYKSYYGVIKAVPSMTDYIYLDQMVTYTLIMAIPRAIWPGKPENPGTKAQLYGLGQDAIDSGYAYPNLGEYYYSFGVIGVLFFMSIFGLWLARITNRRRYNANNLIDLVQYCTTVPLTLQLIIRGYTPSNFYLIIALFFPCWVLNYIVSSYNRRHSVCG